jgi:xanthine/uracil permease
MEKIAIKRTAIIIGLFCGLVIWAICGVYGAVRLIEKLF